MALIKNVLLKITYRIVGLILIYIELPLIKTILAETNNTPEDTKEDLETLPSIR
ncbi:MAG: hypothetical protein DMENIID0002_03620 [Rickettsia endosymbiont of Sergentomyia squamirostris]|uniref:Uncharacterized protein n=1 Tax=Candidatus Tisiphia endosymbiont of Sergentomyia squamirostris TaxID=3113639 RepID=A0AAT9G7F4_9RICK